MKKNFNPHGAIPSICVALLIFVHSPVLALDPDTYEPDNSHDQAGNIILNQNGDDPYQQHNLQDTDDQDWIRFYALEGQDYRIEANNPNDTCDLHIELYDGENKLVNGDHGYSGDDEYLEFKECPSDGIYYAKITVHPDESCEGTAYNLRAFRPLSAPTGHIQGKIKDVISGQFIKGAMVKTSGFGSSLSDDEGEYDICELEGDYDLIAEADGYPEVRIFLTLKSPETIQKDILMNVGNINGDEKIDIEDAILALKVATASVVQTAIYKQTSVNNDEQIGLEEAIYVLQEVADLR